MMIQRSKKVGFKNTCSSTTWVDSPVPKFSMFWSRLTRIARSLDAKSFTTVGRTCRPIFRARVNGWCTRHPKVQSYNMSPKYEDKICVPREVLDWKIQLQDVYLKRWSLRLNNTFELKSSWESQAPIFNKGLNAGAAAEPNSRAEASKGSSCSPRDFSFSTNLGQLLEHRNKNYLLQTFEARTRHYRGRVKTPNHLR